jgi:nitrate/nitrite transporter NarK
MWLVGLCAARAAGSTMAMAYPAVLSVVQTEWGLSSTAAGSISSAYQIGTAVALVFVSALADYLDPRLVFRVSAGKGHGLVPCRLLDGLCAGARRRRGDGGTRRMAGRPLRPGAGAAPLLRPFPGTLSWRALAARGAAGAPAGVLRRRPVRKPFAAALAFQGTAVERAAGLGASLSAIFHIMGIVASAAGGALSDRWGRTAVIAGMMLVMLVSSACSFGFGWMLAAPPLLIVIVGSIYGFSALGDSSVYSTGITETVKPERLGSALAVRSLLGFGAGAIAPLVFGWVLDLYGGQNASVAGWGWAFSALGVGGVLGLLSMLWLRTMPEARRLAGGKR